jgi:hypothetical protein
LFFFFFYFFFFFLFVFVCFGCFCFGLVWDGMGWDGMGWDGIQEIKQIAMDYKQMAFLVLVELNATRASIKYSSK